MNKIIIIDKDFVVPIMCFKNKKRTIPPATEAITKPIKFELAISDNEMNNSSILVMTNSVVSTPALIKKRNISKIILMGF